jgi:hypothetical protein
MHSRFALLISCGQVENPQISIDIRGKNVARIPIRTAGEIYGGNVMALLSKG